MSVAERTLRKVLDNIIDQLQYKNAEITLKELTSGGANYTSALFSATISGTDKDSLKLFAKVANVSGKLREAVNLDFLFKTEQFVYQDLVQVYEKLQDKHNVSPEHRFEFPKFYGSESAEGEETIVMEDLTAKGYGTYSRFKSIDWEHAAAAVQLLTKFHALSFAYQKEDPENFAKAAEIVKLPKKDESENPNMVETWKKMIGAAISVTNDEHKEKLAKLLSPETSRDEFYKFRSPLSTTVLCHGDYRVSNLMFRRQNDTLEPVVVDFQTVHSGCPVTDLLYLEFLGTDQEFRRENHGRLKDYYFRELTAALDRLGLDVNEVYPRETFENEYKKMLSSALCITMVVLPLVLVEAEQAPDMGGMKEVGDFVISPTELFAERFSGVVSDCVAWGAL